MRKVLDERMGAEELRGMPRLRRAEPEAAVAETTARLAQVEARLRTNENEGHMNTDDVVVKRIPAVRVAELSAVARGYQPQDISPVIGPLFDELCRRLAAAGVTPVGPGIAYYEDAPGGDGIRAHAALPVAAEPEDGHGFAIVDLPAIERAATIVHRGPMDDVLATEQTPARWIADGGHRSAGYARELYLEVGEDPARWVTELQEPLAA